MVEGSAEGGGLDDWRALVNMLPSMLAFWDTDLRCRFANRAYEDWFGVTADSLIGTSLRDLLGPDLFALNEPYVRAALAGHEQEFERVVPGPGGASRHSLALYKPHFVDGRVDGFLVHVTDVSKLKRTESALREEVAGRQAANDQLLATHHALSEAQRLGGIGSWEWDAATDRTTWSEQLYRTFGLDPRKPAPDFDEQTSRYTPESWSRLREVVARSLATGEPYQVDLEYRNAAGERGWAEARGEAIRDGKGRVTGLRGTVLDITERQRARELLRQRDLAEQSSRNKTVFLSRVSHELRTPLNGILGSAQILRKRVMGNEEATRWINTIESSGRNMAALVDELLDLSAAELDHLRLNISHVDMLVIAREVVTSLLPVAEAAEVRLSCDFGACAHAIAVADAARVRQILNNLISNGIKYNHPAGEVHVTLRPRSEHLVIEVADTGHGIEPELMNQLYTPFSRLGAERTKIPGTGLGLALTKRLVELMGGEITAENRTSGGTQFTVTLPSATGSELGIP